MSTPSQATTATATTDRPQPSTTHTETILQPGTQPAASQPQGVLRLRGAPTRNAPRVTWTEDVVDNEGCGKKKSKICCIYHKPRQFDESSDESSGDDSDGSADSRRGRPTARQHDHAHHHEHGHQHQHRPAGPSRNAYEAQPKPDPSKSS